MRLDATKNFWRDYEKLPETIKDKVDGTMAVLAQNPHHPSLRTHKRRGEKDVWQARVTRSYRLMFKLEDDLILLISFGSHE